MFEWFKQFDPNPVYISWLLGTVTGAGVLSLLLSIWWRKDIGRVIPESLPIYFIPVIQLLAGMAAVGGAYSAGGTKTDWKPAAIWGVCCVFAWTLVKIYLDTRYKKIKEEGQEAKRMGSLRTALLRSLRESVYDKVKRLTKSIKEKKVCGQIGTVRHALQPEGHLEELLQSVVAFFFTVNGSNPAVNFRVGLYALRNSTVALIGGYNLRNPNSEVFRSCLSHPNEFKYDTNDDPSTLIQCLRKCKSIVVEDCLKADGNGKGEFHFFHTHQKEYLGSIFAYYLDEVCLEDGSLCKAALVIDTDQVGFFQQSEQQQLEFFLQEFAPRVKLELLLQVILAPGDKKNGNNGQNQNTKKPTRKAAKKTSQGDEAGTGQV